MVVVAIYGLDFEVLSQLTCHFFLKKLFSLEIWEPWKRDWSYSNIWGYHSGMRSFF